jgi:hypothetical protein
MQLGFGTSKVGQIEMNMWKYYGIIFPKVWDKPTDTLFCIIYVVYNSARSFLDFLESQIPPFLSHRFPVVKNITNRPFLGYL